MRVLVESGKTTRHVVVASTPTDYACEKGDVIVAINEENLPASSADPIRLLSLMVRKCRAAHKDVVLHLQRGLGEQLVSPGPHLKAKQRPPLSEKSHVSESNLTGASRELTYSVDSALEKAQTELERARAQRTVMPPSMSPPKSPPMSPSKRTVESRSRELARVKAELKGQIAQVALLSGQAASHGEELAKARAAVASSRAQVESLLKHAGAQSKRVMAAQVELDARRAQVADLTAQLAAAAAAAEKEKEEEENAANKAGAAPSPQGEKEECAPHPRSQSNGGGGGGGGGPSLSTLAAFEGERAALAEARVAELEAEKAALLAQIGGLQEEAARGGARGSSSAASVDRPPPRSAGGATVEGPPSADAASSSSRQIGSPRSEVGRSNDSGDGHTEPEAPSAHIFNSDGSSILPEEWTAAGGCCKLGELERGHHASEEQGVCSILPEEWGFFVQPEEFRAATECPDLREPNPGRPTPQQSSSGQRGVCLPADFLPAWLRWIRTITNAPVAC